MMIGLYASSITEFSLFQLKALQTGQQQTSRLLENLLFFSNRSGSQLYFLNQAKFGSEFGFHYLATLVERQ